MNMKFDCGFRKENNRFRYRAGGIIIHRDRMPFVKSSVGGCFCMIGGGAALGESSSACIEREVREEAVFRASAEYLAVVCENFFRGIGGKIDGPDCHTIEFCCRMRLPDDPSLCKRCTDDGEEPVWIPLNEVRSADIKPVFIKENIDRILKEKTVLHVIEERDRQAEKAALRPDITESSDLI